MSNLISVPRDLAVDLLDGLRITQERARKELRALLAKPAEQHQGEPVAWALVNGNDQIRDLTDRWDVAKHWDGIVHSLYTRPAEQPAPAAVVPEGYCVMPRLLTAENGAKALLLGEFTLQSTHECPECRELEEPSEGCEICDGEGEYGQKHTIPWDQFKFIYSKAIEGLAVKAEPAKF